MNAGRRSFIKTTGTGTLGLSFLPAVNSITDILGLDTPFYLPQASPESQGISSTAIRSFIKAANASGIGWHSFMLLRHGT
jgi:hypothetical protein